VAIIWKIESDGRVRYIDAHPDNSLTRGFYDLRFARASPGMGAGFKNWRPIRLEGFRSGALGALVGGHIRLASNAEIADFSLTQFYGTGRRSDDWREGQFVLNGQSVDYYDYVRAKLAGGALSFDPVQEVADMVSSNCADFSYRADAVQLALQVGLQGCQLTSMAPMAIGKTIPRRLAMPVSRPPSRSCATTKSVSWISIAPMIQD
jgi:hypothetical protein